MNTRRRLPITAVALLVAVVVFAFDLLLSANLFESAVRVVESLGAFQIDELIIPALIIGGGLLIDLIVGRRRHEAEIQAQRLRVLRATMLTVQDIVNNFLNSLQLFRLEAASALSPESSALFDSLLQDTAAKLKVLGELATTPEKQSAQGTVIDYGKPPS